ncbi:MAG: DUF6504 family protein [Streptosporangiaceae bacterium]
MRPTRGEPVEVWQRHGKPARFVWRGRLYTVLFVRDKRAFAGASQPGGENGQLSRECWLVEATPERAVPASVFELCYEAAADRWTLSRS